MSRPSASTPAQPGEGGADRSPAVCQLRVARLDALAVEQAALVATLDEAERGRQARFATEALQRRFALAHGMLRAVLSDFTGLPARDFAFRAGPKGRPELVTSDADAEARLTAIDFNLSYSGDLVACAVTRGLRVGIDIERVDQRIDTVRLERRVMSEAERQRLAKLAPGDRRRCFYAIWVLKESWAKARGEGLALPFDAVTLMPEGPGVRVDLSGVEEGSPAWRFRRWALGSEAELALTLQRTDAPAPELHWVLDGVPVPREGDRF